MTFDSEMRIERGTSAPPNTTPRNAAAPAKSLMALVTAYHYAAFAAPPVLDPAGSTSSFADVGYGGNSGAANVWETTPQVGSGYAISFHTDNTVLEMAPPLGTGDPTQVVGFRYKHNAPVSSTILTYFDDYWATPTIYVVVNSSYYLEVWRNDTTAPVLLTTSSAPIDTTAWLYLELKVLCDAASGSVDLHVNGTSVATFAGVTKTNQQGDSWNVGFTLQNGVSQPGCFDDLYVLDSTDPHSIGRNTDFLGPRCVWTLRPSADSSVQWTPSSGSNNYSLVRDINGPDGDATYVEAATAGLKDKYVCDSLPAGVGDISGLTIFADARSDGSVSFSLLGFVYSTGGGGGTEFDGPSIASGSGLNTTYTSPYLAICETDPDTSAQWTASSNNSSLLGVGTV